MKLKIGNYEVTISAKNEYSERGSRFDTMALLNSISIWALESAIRYEQLNCFASAERARKAGEDIYEELVKHGFYKKNKTK